MAEIFSLATGVLQVVDFGARFLNTAQKLAQATPDGAKSFDDLQIASRNLTAVVNSLLSEAVAANARSRESNDAQLATECAETLTEMLQTIEKATSAHSKRKRNPAIAAFKIEWNRERTEDLHDRLDRFSKQLTLSLALTIRTQAATSLENQKQILDKLNAITDTQGIQSNESVSTSASGFGSMVIEYLCRQLVESSRKDLKLNLRQGLLNTIHQGQSNTGDPSNISMPDAHRNMVAKVFLSKLSYPGIKDREEDISEAHKKTFRWVFDHPEDESVSWSNLRTWLESDEQIYWVTGKAGAGKSTLMKFITQAAEHSAEDSLPRCVQYIKKGNPERPVAIASFYFWASGSTIQKSQTGLLLTLLDQLLGDHPSSIPFASPSRWEALALFGDEPAQFTEKELWDMLYRTVSHVSSTARVVLFVDGLDEFNGDLSELLHSLEKLIHFSESTIKLCVSSRPWVEFGRAFDSRPSLQLEDLTHGDIKNYINARFHEDSRFADLQRKEEEAADALAETIVSKASGVFLWVRLVVNSLLTGMGFGDRISDLKRRLDLLPSDLEKLYDRILDSLDPFYSKHASEYFARMQSCPEPPLALLFSFSDEDALTEFITDMDGEFAETSKLKDRVNDMRLRINSRCKGLIEVDRRHQESSDQSFIFDTRVHYLHKTVKDYIEGPRAQEKLVAVSEDTHARLLAASIALVKVWGCSGRMGDVNECILACMHHAARAATTQNADIIHLLHILRSTMIAMEIDSSALTIRNKLIAHLSETDEFLCLAMVCGVLPYVNSEANKGCLVGIHKGRVHTSDYWHQGALKLLHRIFPDRELPFQERGFSLNRNYPLLQLPFLKDPLSLTDLDAAMIEALLNNGADPNYITAVEIGDDYLYTTPWESLITAIAQVFEFNWTDKIAQRAVGTMARLMIRHGARVKLSIVSASLSSMFVGVEEIAKIIYAALNDIRKSKSTILKIEKVYTLYPRRSRRNGRIRWFFGH